MNLNLTAKLRARHRKVLVGSIAALGLAGSVLGRDVTWNGPLISVDGGAEMPWDGVLNSVGSMDDVTLKASTVVTLAGSGSTVLENAILNSSLGQPGVTTLTINSTDATSRTLVSAVTTLAGASGQSLVIAGSADFRTGFLSDGGFGNVQLVKDGGTGELILDGLSNDPNANDLDGALLRVVTGTISVEGGGGTASPISSLVQSIRIDNAAGKLRLGTPNGTATTFGNSLLVNESGTLEHTAASNDLLTGGVLIQTGKILTTNITGGSLTLAGSVAVGGLNKTGAATLILSGVNTTPGPPRLVPAPLPSPAAWVIPSSLSVPEPPFPRGPAAASAMPAPA